MNFLTFWMNFLTFRLIILTFLIHYIFFILLPYFILQFIHYIMLCCVFKVKNVIPFFSKWKWEKISKKYKVYNFLKIGNFKNIYIVFYGIFSYIINCLGFVFRVLFWRNGEISIFLKIGGYFARFFMELENLSMDFPKQSFMLEENLEVPLVGFS